MSVNWLASLPAIGGFFKEVGEAIDRNVTTDEERLKLKAELTSLYVPVLQAVVEAQKQANEMQVKLAEIEAKSEHWLVWARRPIIAFMAMANFILAGFLHHMDVDSALYLALLVNGLDTGTRGLTHIVSKLKEKEKI